MSNENIPYDQTSESCPEEKSTHLEPAKLKDLYDEKLKDIYLPQLEDNFCPSEESIERANKLDYSKATPDSESDIVSGITNS